MLVKIKDQLVNPQYITTVEIRTTQGGDGPTPIDFHCLTIWMKGSGYTEIDCDSKAEAGELMNQLYRESGS